MSHGEDELTSWLAHHREALPNTTRFANRLRSADHLHIEGGPLAVGPVEPGWLSAQWVVEPVEPVASTWFRFRSLWKPQLGA